MMKLTKLIYIVTCQPDIKKSPFIKLSQEPIVGIYRDYDKAMDAFTKLKNVMIHHLYEAFPENFENMKDNAFFDDRFVSTSKKTGTLIKWLSDYSTPSYPDDGQWKMIECASFECEIKPDFYREPYDGCNYEKLATHIYVARLQ